MALVSPSRFNISAIDKAVQLRNEEERAAFLRAECILRYQHRKATGQVPLANLIEINKRGNEQCS